MVVNTGGWLIRRDVLISPIAVAGKVDWKEGLIHVLLDKEKVENSPDIDSQKPVSREMEDKLSRYYGWPQYWYGPSIWGMEMSPGALASMTIVKNMPEKMETMEESIDTYLRSYREVKGYSIQALDGEIGRLDDLLLEDLTWSVRYLIVDTGDWLSGKMVIFGTKRIQDISWTDRSMDIRVKKDKVENVPEFDSAQPVDRWYEEKVEQFYE
jgi:hypothetical protein